MGRTLPNLLLATALLLGLLVNFWAVYTGTYAKPVSVAFTVLLLGVLSIWIVIRVRREDQ